MRHFSLILLLTVLVHSSVAQSYRGISVLNDSICWISGSKGTVIKTLDGGHHWDTISPSGFSTKEFRDIHVYDKNTALVMSSGDSAVILKTTDGGANWRLVHSNNRPGVFYDAMDVLGPFAVVVGDPYRAAPESPLQFDFIASSDSGETWNKDFTSMWAGFWEADSGEALFAASGGNIQLDYKEKFDPLQPDYRKLRYTMVTGGLNARYYTMGSRTELPWPECSSCGPYAHMRAANKKLVLVGGNYLKPDERQFACQYFDPQKKALTWSDKPPGGYRSGVAEYGNGQFWVCTGTNGTDISFDDGKTWDALPLSGFNAVAFSENYLWLCGNKGEVKRVAVEEVRR